MSPALILLLTRQRDRALATKALLDIDLMFTAARAAQMTDPAPVLQATRRDLRKALGLPEPVQDLKANRRALVARLTAMGAGRN